MTHHEGNTPEDYGGAFDRLPDTTAYGRDVTDRNALPATPDRLPPHSAEYPAAFLEQPTRELLRLSQTNVTADPILGGQYAAAAYDKARQDESGTDTTAAGEAAAKAGFRATQAGHPDEVIEAWFQRSNAGLYGPGPAREREGIATDLLHARSLSLRALQEVVNGRHIADPESDELSKATKAKGHYEYADWILRQQHTRGRAWDRYASMVSRHHATHEAIFGTRRESAKVALGGIGRAIRADQEKARAPETTSKQAVVNHAKFVGKQVLANTAALALAVTQPRKATSRWAARHRAIAAKMLG